MLTEREGAWASPGLNEVSVRLGQSKMLAALILAGYGGAAGCVFAAHLPLPVRLILLLALLPVGGQHLRMSAWRSHRMAISGLRVRLDGYCELGRVRGWTEVVLSPKRFVSPWLTLIAVRTAGDRLPLAVVIPFDALPRDDYRRLRLLLRLGAAPGQAAAAGPLSGTSTVSRASAARPG